MDLTVVPVSFAGLGKHVGPIGRGQVTHFLFGGSGSWGEKCFPVRFRLKLCQECLVLADGDLVTIQLKSRDRAGGVAGCQASSGDKDFLVCEFAGEIQEKAVVTHPGCKGGKSDRP